MKTIEDIQKCQCGAITLWFKDGTNVSMKHSTYKEIFGGKRLKTTLAKSYDCNHCTNHWGIDLCGCGSGKKVGKCHDGFAECNAGSASQYLDYEIIRPMWRS